MSKLKKTKKKYKSGKKISLGETKKLKKFKVKKKPNLSAIKTKKFSDKL